MTAVQHGEPASRDEPGAIAHALGRDRLLPVVVLDDAAAAVPLGHAIRSGGLSCIEITLRTPAALDAIAALAREGELLVGAGTVLTRDQAERAIAAGARFVVSPGLSASVVSHCLDVGVPVFPGVATPTEIQAALELGVQVVKFFPADILGGLAAIKALAGPFGDVRFVPTGGVSPDNVSAYLRHPSVLAVGGSWMATRAAIAAADWGAITALVSAAVVQVGERRG
jgi:2-dehydro-3-deoxyphosphogluconate aldolase/(4S)-4-hydroxy-2-oxoglutarate aldolase